MILPRERLLVAPDRVPQPRLVVGLHADEFDAGLSVSRPSHHGQIDRQRFIRIAELDLDPEILQVGIPFIPVQTLRLK